MEERRSFKNKNGEKYKEMQQKIKQEIRKAKEKWLEGQCAEIEVLIKKNDNFNLHKKLKEAGELQTSFYSNLVHRTNQLILSKQEKLATWTNYIHKLFDDNRTQPEMRQQQQGDNLHILPSEVEHAIRIAKPGKACGPDQVPVELWKQLDYDNIRKITN